MGVGFSDEVRKQLRSYVYLYVDPRNGKVFYVGKGVGNRAFAHLNADSKTTRGQTIRAIRDVDQEPRIEILKYGINDDEAHLVEAAAIDLLKLDELDNEVHGHRSDFGIRSVWQEIQNDLSAATAAIKVPAILFNLSKSFRLATTPIQLYDKTRSAWGVDIKKARKAKYAFAVFREVVREVYEIREWLSAGSTLTAFDKQHTPDPERHEFVGVMAPDALRKRHKGKHIEGIEQFGQTPFRYLNID